MAESVRIMQSRPTAATLTDLYTVAASTKFVGQLFICNDTTGAINARVSIADDGAADATSQYVVKDKNINGGETLSVTGITLGATDIIRVYAASAGLVFTLNGVDVT
jgi:hypothetical protein